MSNISEIKQRARALAEKTDANSVTPQEVGGIMYDLGAYGENTMRNGGTLGIRKVYASIEEMEADNTNPVDLWGDPIKKGNLVVIYDGANGEHNNEVYAFLKPGWKLATNLDAGYAMKADVDAKLSDLAHEVENDVNSNRYGYNVTVNGLNGGIHTLESAINDVPSKHRMLGQKITFRTQNGDWATYHNESLSLDNYNNVNDWVQEVGISEVTGDVNINNAPDYEDLTEAKDGTIKFADKEYSADSFSGLGRVYLRKNIVDGKNVLTQDMVSKKDTIYIIQYDYNLTGAEITIPEGCVLDFQGGKVDNGSLTCNNTIIKGSINGDVSISGTYYNYNYNIPKNEDVTDLIQKILDENNYLYLETGTYYITKPLVIRNSGTTIMGESVSNTIIKPASSIESIITTKQNDTDVSSVHKVLTYITVKNIHLSGNDLANKGIEYVYDSNCYFENMRVTRCNRGLKISGWSHTFIHCSLYGNIIGGFFSNAFNQCSFIGCYFNTNRVGFYASGTNVLFYGCDIERNKAVGCMCSGSSVEMRECYFESNASIGLEYSSNYESSELDCFYYPNGGAIYTKTLKADVITRVNPKILDNGVVVIGLSNSWLADNLNISRCFFNSSVDCAVIGSASKIKLTDNVFEFEYPCVYGIIPSYKATIIKQMDIYDNYVDRENVDGERLKPVKSIKTFYDKANTSYLFWNFLQNNKHKIYTGHPCLDYGKNIYNFNNKIVDGNGGVTTTKLKIESYNNKEVIYRAELLGADNYNFGFHTYTDDGSISFSGLIPDTIYCFEAELKLSRELLDGESISFNFVNSSITTQKYTIKGLSTDIFTKVYYYVYYDSNLPENWFESNLYGVNINEDISLYIKNPRFYNVCMEEDNSGHYFSYLRYSTRNPSNYDRPYTSGVRVGERMAYIGSNETLRKRNLVCIKTGDENSCDTWADISYDIDIPNNGLSQIKITSLLSTILNSGAFGEKPKNVPVGFAYYCTDRQTDEGATNGIMIYHKGNNVWVDALGRVVE